MLGGISLTEEEEVALNERIEEGVGGVGWISLSEEEVGGSLVVPQRSYRQAEAGVEEGGPFQVEVEGSWLAGFAGGGWASGNSWQLKEVVEEGMMSPEVAEGGTHLMEEEEEVEEVEVGCSQSSEETENRPVMLRVQETDKC